MPSSGVPAPIVAYSQIQDLELWTLCQRGSAGRRASPTTSPTTRTTSTTACAPICSRSTILPSVPLVGDILREIDAEHPGLEPARRVHETRAARHHAHDRGCDRRKRAARARAQAALVGDVREAPAAVVAFSPAMEKADRDIKGFLYPRMYRHRRVMRVMDDAESVVRDSVRALHGTPRRPAGGMARGLRTSRRAARARRIADYIAGMTDRYALTEHARCFKDTPDLR